MSLKPITREEMFLAKAGGEDVGELKPITRREKFLDRIAGGGGADLLETVGGDTLTWDGNTEGLSGVDLMGQGANTHWCVSENTPSDDELLNSDISLIVSHIGETVTHTGLSAVANPDIDGFYTINEIHVIITTHNIEADGMIIMPKGIYFLNADIIGAGSYTCVKSLTVNGYTGFTKTALKEEYLPSTGTLIDLDNPNVELTTSDGMFIVTNIPFTPVLNRLKRGESVVVKMEGCYFTPIMYVDEGGGVTIMINTGNETIVIILQTP